MQRFPSPAPPPLENFTLVAPSFRNAPAATLSAGPPAAWQKGRKKSYAGWRQKKRGEVPLPSKTLLWSLQAFATRLPPLCLPVPRRHGKKAGKKATPDGGRKKEERSPSPRKLYSGRSKLSQRACRRFVRRSPGGVTGKTGSREAPKDGRNDGESSCCVTPDVNEGKPGRYGSAPLPG